MLDVPVVAVDECMIVGDALLEAAAIAVVLDATLPVAEAIAVAEDGLGAALSPHALAAAAT